MKCIKTMEKLSENQRCIKTMVKLSGMYQDNGEAVLDVSRQGRSLLEYIKTMEKLSEMYQDNGEGV